MYLWALLRILRAPLRWAAVRLCLRGHLQHLGQGIWSQTQAPKLVFLKLQPPRPHLQAHQNINHQRAKRPVFCKSSPQVMLVASSLGTTPRHSPVSPTSEGGYQGEELEEGLGKRRKGSSQCLQKQEREGFLCSPYLSSMPCGGMSETKGTLWGKEPGTLMYFLTAVKTLS